MDPYQHFAGLLWIAIFCFTTVHCVAEQPLYFTLLVSNASTLNTTGAITAVDQALKVVNNDSDILSGYSLQYFGVLVTKVMLSLDHCWIQASTMFSIIKILIISESTVAQKVT